MEARTWGIKVAGCQIRRQRRIINKTVPKIKHDGQKHRRQNRGVKMAVMYDKVKSDGLRVVPDSRV